MTQVFTDAVFPAGRRLNRPNYLVAEMVGSLTTVADTPVDIPGCILELTPGPWLVWGTAQESGGTLYDLLMIYEGRTGSTGEVVIGNGLDGAFGGGYTLPWAPYTVPQSVAGGKQAIHLRIQLSTAKVIAPGIVNTFIAAWQPTRFTRPQPVRAVPAPFPAGTIKKATMSGAQNGTSTLADISGLVVTLDPGVWLVWAHTYGSYSGGMAFMDIESGTSGAGTVLSRANNAPGQFGGSVGVPPKPVLVQGQSEDYHARIKLDTTRAMDTDVHRTFIAALKVA